MKTITYTAVIVAALALGACAKRPDAIAPVAAPSGAYDGLSCQQAMVQRNATATNLNTLSRAQNSAATGDAIGVFLIGVPFSKFGGDKEGLIATEKGKMEALDARLASCS